MDDHAFTRDVAAALRCDTRRAEALGFIVLDELRQRLTPAEANDVAAQLPASLKRAWLEQERYDRTVTRMHALELVGRVRLRAGLLDYVEAERAVVAVFRTLQRLLGSPSGTEGEAWDVFSQLPIDWKRLWLGAAAAPPLASTFF